MIYKQFGNTGLEVSVLSFGAAPLGGEYGEISVEEGKRAVRHAIDSGINYFDTSPYYGRTASERRLGDALRDGYREKVILATKCGRYGKSLPDGFDFTADRILKSIDESLERLQTDYVDVLQLHDIEFWDKNRILDEALPALHQIKESGKARFIGVTGYPVHLLAAVAEAADIDMVLTYCRANLLDMSADRVLRPVVEKKGLGMVNASTLHMRVLTAIGAPEWHPAPDEVHEAARKAYDYCLSVGANLTELALQYALNYDLASTICVGMDHVNIVNANVKLVGTQPDPEILSAVQQIIAPVRNIYWKTGLPENSDPGARDPR